MFRIVWGQMHMDVYMMLKSRGNMHVHLGMCMLILLLRVYMHAKMHTVHSLCVYFTWSVAEWLSV
jgi:hypothetical protein